MQKALIVSIFLVFFILKVKGQQIKINGTYCAKEYISDFGMCFTFQKDKTFKYISNNDLPPYIVGKGTFELDKNFLILNYKSSDLYNFSYHKISQSLSIQDSIFYRFKVSEIDGNPIPGTEVIYENPQTKITQGFILDKEGEGSMVLPKSVNKLQLRFSYVGYNPYTVEINQDNDYFLEVFLAKKGQHFPISPHTEIFEIITVQESYIELRNFKGKLSKWFKRT